LPVLIKALLVEDNPSDTRMIQELLKQAGGREIAVRHAARLGTALEKINAERPDVVILDLSLPDSTGLASFHRLHQYASSVPIVVLTGLDDSDMAVQTIVQGASDYLLKGELSGGLLVRSLHYSIERKRMQEALQRTQSELELKNRIAQIVLTTADDRMYAEVLGHVVEFMQSDEGKFGYLDAQGAFVCAALGGECRPRHSPASTLRLPPEEWTGVWGQALREKRLVCINPLSGRRGLAAPLIEGGWIIGLISVAGRPTDYRDSDQRFLEILAAYLAPVVRARVQRDVHDKALAAALAAKEVLLREVHHRVKNNLQIVASLLNMQAESLPDSFRAPLEESQRRVRSMALVHEQLYSYERPDQLDFGAYVDSLSHDLFAAFSTRSGEVRLALEADPVVLGVDQAVPCGLILNELVTNSLKHAFPSGRTGEVRVELHSRDGEIRLRVADDGIGLPPEFDCRRSNSLGLRIVEILAAQLNGNLTWGSEGGGSQFTLIFPARKS
jgi:two-component sensor histidine kinase/DNA-binding response OmpR family regulator